MNAKSDQLLCQTVRCACKGDLDVASLYSIAESSRTPKKTPRPIHGTTPEGSTFFLSFFSFLCFGAQAEQLWLDAERFSLWPARRVLSNKSSASSGPAPLQPHGRDGGASTDNTRARRHSSPPRLIGLRCCPEARPERRRRSPNEARELTGSFEASGRQAQAFHGLSFATSMRSTLSERNHRKGTCHARPVSLLQPSRATPLFRPYRRAYRSAAPFSSPDPWARAPTLRLTWPAPDSLYAARSPRRSGSGPQPSFSLFCSSVAIFPPLFFVA